MRHVAHPSYAWPRLSTAGTTSKPPHAGHPCCPRRRLRLFAMPGGAYAPALVLSTPEGMGAIGLGGAASGRGIGGGPSVGRP